MKQGGIISDLRLSNAACDAAQLPPSGLPDEPTPVTSNGVVYYEDGGDPIYLDGNIYLCARTDGDSYRFFSGSVAQAGFYDEALNATDIQVRTHCWYFNLMHQMQWLYHDLLILQLLELLTLTAVYPYCCLDMAGGQLALTWQVVSLP